MWRRAASNMDGEKMRLLIIYLNIFMSIYCGGVLSVTTKTVQVVKFGGSVNE